MCSMRRIVGYSDNLIRFNLKKVIASTVLLCIFAYLLIYSSSNRSLDPSLRDNLVARMQRKSIQLLCNDSSSIRNLVNSLRAYRYLKIENVFDENRVRSLLVEFEREMFPWMRTSDSALNGYQHGNKGIVICVNDKYLKIGISSIFALEAVGNQLPIEIMFYQDSELSLNNRELLRNLPFVARVIDMSSVFNNYTKHLPIGTDIRRTYGKPFAILASSFQHVLMMDADVYFFQKPSNLFHHSGYLSTGFLIFNDRTIWPDNKRTAWIKSIIPQPYSDKFNRSRLVRGISSVEIESGVVVVNKGIRTSYLALLVICMLNTLCFRRNMLNNHQYHGEKETYWIGLQMLGVPYYQEPTVGLVGSVSKQGDDVCGHTFHADESKSPLWWNGGFRQRKDDEFSSWINFTSYLWEPESSNASDWLCLHGAHGHIQKLSEQHLELIRTYTKYNCSSFKC